MFLLYLFHLVYARQMFRMMLHLSKRSAFLLPPLATADRQAKSLLPALNSLGVSRAAPRGDRAARDAPLLRACFDGAPGWLRRQCPCQGRGSVRRAPQRRHAAALDPLVQCVPRQGAIARVPRVARCFCIVAQLVALRRVHTGGLCFVGGRFPAELQALVSAATAHALLPRLRARSQAAVATAPVTDAAAAIAAIPASAIATIAASASAALVAATALAATYAASALATTMRGRAAADTASVTAAAPTLSSARENDDHRGPARRPVPARQVQRGQRQRWAALGFRDGGAGDQQLTRSASVHQDQAISRSFATNLCHAPILTS